MTTSMTHQAPSRTKAFDYKVRTEYTGKYKGL